MLFAVTIGLLSTVIIPIHIGLKLVIALIIIISWLYHYWQMLKHLGRYQAQGIELLKNRNVKLYKQDGEFIDNGNVTNFFISTWIITIIVHGTRRYVLLVFPMMLSADEYRHLRIGLKRY